jgi:hypothetical protein
MHPDFTVFYRDSKTIDRDGKSVGMIYRDEVIRLAGNQLTRVVFEGDPEFDEGDVIEGDEFFTEERHTWTHLQTHTLSDKQVADVDALLKSLRGQRCDTRVQNWITMGYGDQGFYSRGYDFLFLGHIREPIQQLWSKVSVAAGGPEDVADLSARLSNTDLPDNFVDPWSHVRYEVNALLRSLESHHSYVGPPYIWPFLEDKLKAMLGSGVSEVELLNTAIPAILHRGVIPAKGLQGGRSVQLSLDENDELTETTIYMWEAIKDRSVNPRSDLVRWGVLSRSADWFAQNAPAVLEMEEWKSLVQYSLSTYRIFQSGSSITITE